LKETKKNKGNLRDQRKLCRFETDTGKSKGALEDEKRLQNILEELRGTLEDQSGDLRRGVFPDEHTFKKGRGGGGASDMEIRYSVDYKRDVIINFKFGIVG